MSCQDRHREASDIVVNCAVITLSDTRTKDNDASGAAIQRLLVEAKHKIAQYQIIRDEPGDLDQLLARLLADKEVDAILTTGGTGISPRDQTIPVIRRRLETVLDGFGELFRMLSWQEIGSSAMLSRAIAGVARRKLIFAMPGSTSAVELAMTKLVLPELRHLVLQLSKAE